MIIYSSYIDWLSVSIFVLKLSCYANYAKYLRHTLSLLFLFTRLFLHLFIFKDQIYALHNIFSMYYFSISPIYNVIWLINTSEQSRNCILTIAMRISILSLSTFLKFLQFLWNILNYILKLFTWYIQREFYVIEFSYLSSFLVSKALYLYIPVLH